jgi:hypothetical protein
MWHTRTRHTVASVTSARPTLVGRALPMTSLSLTSLVAAEQAADRRAAAAPSPRPSRRSRSPAARLPRARDGAAGRGPSPPAAPVSDAPGRALARATARLAMAEAALAEDGDRAVQALYGPSLES